VIDANLTSTFLTVREFLPGMIARRHGAVVTMSSISGRYLDKLTQAAYAAAKAGVIMFTTVLTRRENRGASELRCARHNHV
jgi:3-oxoacyl-[acyl-carrier protein] reductase